jgi:hypothetical protein
MQRSLIEEQLRPGERLLWKGKPDLGIRFRPSDGFMIPFSLLWGGFAIFWFYSAFNIATKSGQPEAFLFSAFGIPFVLFGLYFIFGRFIVDAKMRSKTEYAVTNQRAIIQSGMLSRKIKTVNLQSIPDISYAERSDGSGTVTFGESTSSYSWATGGFYFPGMSSKQAPAFEMIPDVKRVYDLILESKSKRDG